MLDKLSIKKRYKNGIDILSNSQLAKAYDLKREAIDIFFRENIIEEVITILQLNLSQLKLGERRRIKELLLRDFEHILDKVIEKKGYIKKIYAINQDKKTKILQINITLEDLSKSKYFIKATKVNLEIEDVYSIQEGFKVVFVSPFTYGKSMLINAIIGEELLASDIRAETANITKLIYGTQSNLLLKNKGVLIDEIQYASLDELAEELTQSTSVRGEGNTIDEVMIQGEFGIDSDITLMDSPGLFSPYAHHDGITMKALEEADMILFLMEPSHIGESNYSAFIKSYVPLIISEKKDVCFIITKRDLYDIYEENKILEETKVVLEEIGLEGEDIYFVSAYMGLKSSLVMKGKEDIASLQNDRNIFVEKDGEILRGRNIRQSHVKDIWKYSQIEYVRTRIQQSKLLYGRQGVKGC